MTERAYQGNNREKKQKRNGERREERKKTEKKGGCVQGKDTATRESQTKFHRRTQENIICSRCKISNLKCVTVLGT